MGLEYTRCDLCGADNQILLFEGKDRLYKLPGSFPVVMCQECQLVYVNPRPDRQSLASYYPDNYSPFGQGKGLIGRLKKLLRTVEAKRIRRHLPEQARVLEVGCAAGDLLVPLRELGLHVSGIEMSPHAASIARERHGLTVHTGTLFDAVFAESSFDAVVMRHVVEHFPSPKMALEKAMSYLKPGGLLFITTPNAASFDRKLFGQYWYAFDPPRHLVVFSEDTLRKMLEKVGLELVQTGHSIVPNNWIGSVKNVLEEFKATKPFSPFMSLRNPFALLFFVPVGVFCKLVRKSGIVEVMAIKVA